ncbi:MAG: LPXTG cell wall anchor domain-containing protein, partial [Eubacterium sp.]|nr:LPXTG cell wall anchor domain-containing protein [Candidatus Colimonas fimequi]
EPGFTYDGTNYTATVTVVNDNGQLKVDNVEYVDDADKTASSITFTNEYIPEAAFKQLFAEKTLINETTREEMYVEPGYFTFELTEVNEDGQAIGSAQTKHNTDGGVVAFDEIRYTRADAGVHHYQIKETNFREWEPGDGYLAFSHVKYDETIHNITVTVTDNKETGTLDVSETREDATKYVEGRYQFTNYYSERPHDPRGQTVLVGHKNFENGSLEDVKFHFSLSEINDDGTERLIGEEVTNNQGDFDFTVAYSDEKDARDEPHHLVLREVVTDEDETIDYDREERKIEVLVTRVSPTELKVEDITAGENPTYEFTNYKMIPTDFTPEGFKFMDLRGVKADEFEFAIVEKTGTGVKPVAGNENPVPCDARGEFKFNKIEYTKTTDAGTHVYQIKEVPGKNKLIGYDDSMIEVTVNVVNDGKGHLLMDGEPTYKRIANDGTETALGEITFENEMNPLNIEVGLKAYKELWYRPDETNPEADQRIEKLNAGEFTFAVLNDEQIKFEAVDGEGEDPEQQPLQDVLFYGTNDEDGQVTFDDTLKYSKADIGKTFDYKVVEVKGNDEHVTYDETVFKIRVAVSYDADTDRLVAQVFDENNNPLEATVTDTDGVVYEPTADEFAKLVFDNTYTPDSIGAGIEADKKLIGKKLKAGEFTFQLLDTNTREVIGTTTNDADGYIIFPFADDYFKKVGTYEYTIVEVKGNDKNVTYDDKEYRVAVEVTFDANRQLVANVKYLDGKAVFKNKYRSPKTGDNMPILPLIGMMIASLLGIGGVTFTRRRKDA